jgi:hypothetical protein
MSVRAFYCPGCGAPVDPASQTRFACGYCGSILEINPRKIIQVRISESQATELEIEELPPATLLCSETGRFELSILEQEIPGTLPDGFFPLVLPEGRFALVYLRLIDDKKRSKGGDLEGLCQLVQESLQQEEDPGLAAYHALEHLSRGPYDGKLEVAILLFRPARSTVVVYNAGCQSSLWWVSGEEGRVIDVFGSYPALERKMLRQASDHFSNSPPCYLAADDLVVAVSAAYAGRGGGPYSDGIRSLLESLDEHIGEHPLRVVTLAKNRYWQNLAPAAREEPLAGPLRVAAVRALAPPWPASPAPLGEIRKVEVPGFEFAAHLSPQESLELFPLHDDRFCLVWIDRQSLQPGMAESMTEAILAVLDRPDHGDNENPREAGRQAFARTGQPCTMLVLQLFPKWGRAKWFRRGWWQPLCLGPRGFNDPAGAQMFDEGGEASVYPRARMLFTGSLPLERHAHLAGDLAQQWYGGKASALYSALFAHWRTSSSEQALEKLLRAAQADRPEADLKGTALLTRLSD